MSEPFTSEPEPQPDRPEEARGPDDAVTADLAALADLVAAGVEVDGQVQVAESTWVIYGHTTYDGEVVVGEYHDAAEASAVYRAVGDPGRSPNPDISNPAKGTS